MTLEESKYEYDLENLQTIIPTNRNFKMFVTPKYVHHYLQNASKDYTVDLLLSYSKDSMLFIDIGAHYGFYTLLVGTKFPNIKTIAFEPVPENYEILKRNLELNGLRNAEVHNLAVSNRDETKKFNVSEAYGPGGFYRHPLAGTTKEIGVRTVGFDGFIKDIPKVPTIVKIDTEGHEVCVLEGMRKFLRNIEDVKLILEFNPKMLTGAGYQPEKLLEEVNQSGFDIYFINDEKRETYKLDQIDFEEWRKYLPEEGHANIFCAKKEKSLSVCFFSHSALLAGAERSLLSLVTELIRDHGAICTVLLPNDGPLREELDQVGASTRIINYDWWCDLCLPSDDEITQRLNRSFKTTLEQIKENVKKMNPDVVITFTIVIPWGAITASLLNKPHVWFVREYGKLDHDLKFFFPFRRILGIIKDSSNLILTVSNAVREKLFGNDRMNNVLTIHQNIDIPSEASCQDGNDYFVRANATKLIIAGTVSESKGQEIAILAVKELIQRKKDVELIIVGSHDPWYAKRLKEMVEDENLEAYVRFFDFKKNPYPIFKQADIALTCSKSEAFGRVIQESMLLKKPVIGTNSGGTPELIREGFNGLLYEAGDWEQLAEKIEFLIENKDKMKEFGENGYRYAKENFTREECGGRIYKLLKNIKNDRNPSSNSYWQFVSRNILHILSEVEREHETEIEGLRAGLDKKESQILHLETAAKEKESELSGLRYCLKDRDQSVAELEALVKDKVGRIENLETSLRETEATVNRIYNSYGWKLLLLSYRMMGKILAVNSHLRNAVRRAYRGVVSLSKHLRKESIKSIDEASLYEVVKPASVRIDASTVCQLNCPPCPNAAGEIRKNVGSGFLKFQDFKNIIDDNIWIRDVELSNWGEIFLNPDLLKIIKYAHEKNVVLRADNGANLNRVGDEVLEALVKYGFHSITCSIDGASQETYSIYRRNGNFEKVMEHIRRINHYKSKYNSEFPLLTWQFVAFGHNTHEIGTARKMANDLKMNFYVKLPWDDVYTQTLSPVKEKDFVSEESGLGVSSREEYLEKTGKDYIEETCTQLWKQPQINFDGRVLGCCVNYRGDYGNAFKDGLIECLNNEKINYARQMLLGIKESRDDIPCAVCKLYESRKKRFAWVKDVAAGSKPSSRLTN
jgi:FkbM family methyltransferase